jgi:hypothetical protein
VEDKIKVWPRQARDWDGGRKKRFRAAEAARQCVRSKHRFEDLPTDRDEDSVESDS